jgi:hypothetical protein
VHVGAENDHNRIQLEACIRDVYVTRNWWCHGTGRVTAEECVRAMQATIHILGFLLPKVPSISVAEADAVTTSVYRHIDVVNQACAGVKDVHISAFSQTCLFFMRAMQQLRVVAGLSTKLNKPLTRDHDIAHNDGAIRAMMQSGNLSHIEVFCCEAVLKGRNYIYHGKDADRVLPLLVSACSVSVLLRWLDESAEADASMLNLMACMGIADTKMLLQRVVEGHANQ